MNSIVIQQFLFNNSEYNKYNNDIFKKNIKILLNNSKYYITQHRVNKIIYIDILYEKTIEINKNIIIHIIKSIYPSLTRLYISILERPTEN